MNLNDIPNDIYYNIFPYLCFSDMVLFANTSKSNQLAKILRSKLAKQKTKLISLKDKIITIYSGEAVKKFKFSGENLWKQHMSPLMKDLHVLSYFIINNWIKNENKIISMFSLCYIKHYKEHDKLFQNMSIDHSFVTSIAMYLYD